jgi:hypothetical protein
MQVSRNDELTIRQQWKSKRDLLLKEFQGNPSKTPLAIEIKLIDDRIAEFKSIFEAAEKAK